MIRAEFLVREKTFCGFCISGHAGAAPVGSNDIVCAAVSSAVYLTANAITDVLKLPAQIVVKDNGFCSLLLKKQEQKKAQPFLQALWIHLQQLSGQYPNNLKLFQTEE